MVFPATPLKSHLMTATKFFVLAAFLLLTAGDGYAQSKARKANPPVGLTTGSLNGASLPHSWPFEPRRARCGSCGFGHRASRPARSSSGLNPLSRAIPNPATFIFCSRRNLSKTGDGSVKLAPGAKLHKQPDGLLPLLRGSNLSCQTTKSPTTPNSPASPAFQIQRHKPAVSGARSRSNRSQP